MTLFPENMEGFADVDYSLGFDLAVLVCRKV
jgi:hypothetical protein